MFRRVLPAAALAVALFACSAPPEKERQQAESAIRAARVAGAASYASAPFGAAEAALAQYDAAVTQRDYRQALRLALEARDNAYEALKLAGTEKAAAETRSRHLRTELVALVDAAHARLNGATPPRLIGVASERVRAAVKAAQAALQKSDSQMAAQQVAAAEATLTPAIANLRRDLDLAPASPGRRGR